MFDMLFYQLTNQPTYLPTYANNNILADYICFATAFGPIHLYEAYLWASNLSIIGIFFVFVSLQIHPSINVRVVK